MTDPTQSKLAVYDRIGVGYDRTRRADPTLAAAIAKLLRVQHPDPVLDVGCGTGNYTLAVADRNVFVIGLDQSTLMLRRARAKEPRIDWIAGQAEALPFADNSFAGIFCTMTLHHLNDFEAVFAEIARVLRPGGRFVAFTAFPEQAQQFWLNAYFPELMRRAAARMPGRERIEAAFGPAGLRLVDTEPFNVPENPVDFVLYCGKHRPELYFDARVRSNIFAFTALDLAEEVGTGLALLDEDIANGNFTSVRSRFSDAAGDYVLLVAEKPA
ncbi:MAG: methyltransferase domain-containing protein [Rhodospirillaceae bacterium]|nr:methyltransferase domain-containing protein [Rhodospirillaceae bacterium]